MKKDKILSIICFIIGFAFFIFSFKIKKSLASVSLGPKFWPILLSSVIMILSAFLFIKSLKSEDNEENKGEVEEKTDYPHNLWISFGLLCLYTFLMPKVGFTLSTLIFIFSNMFIMGYKNIKKLIPLAILMTALLVIVFPKVLAIPLPRGMGIFNDISRMFH